MYFGGMLDANTLYHHAQLKPLFDRYYKTALLVRRQYHAPAQPKILFDGLANIALAPLRVELLDALRTVCGEVPTRADLLHLIDAVCFLIYEARGGQDQ